MKTKFNTSRSVFDPHNSKIMEIDPGIGMQGPDMITFIIALLMCCQCSEIIDFYTKGLKHFVTLAYISLRNIELSKKNMNWYLSFYFKW